MLDRRWFRSDQRLAVQKTTARLVTPVQLFTQVSDGRWFDIIGYREWSVMQLASGLLVAYAPTWLR